MVGHNWPTARRSLLNYESIANEGQDHPILLVPRGLNVSCHPVHIFTNRVANGFRDGRDAERVGGVLACKLHAREDHAGPTVAGRADLQQA